MGEFYSKRYFYKGGIGMTQSLKRFASAVLALVMAMTCLVFSNVASVSAAEPATFGTYTIGTSATGNLAVKTKSTTVGNVTFNLRSISTNNGTVRKGSSEITFTTTKSFTINAKFTESSNRKMMIQEVTVRFHLLLLQKQAVKNHQVQQLLQKQLQQQKQQLKQQLRLLQKPQLFQVTMLQWVLMIGIQLL